MKGRVGLFFWRRQGLLAAVYLGLLALGWLVFLGATYLAPESLDVGAAVVARAVAYHASFDEVEAARRDVEQGRYDAAVRRLERFLGEHHAVQRSQLETHAVVEAHELLAEVYQRQGRPGRAIRLLRALTERVPLDYRAWWQRGLAEKAGGRLGDAAPSLRQAFLLTLNHPGVAEAYLAVLADLTDHEQIVWVADQFRRAGRRAAPIALVKVGAPRNALQAAGLAWAGVPIEHANFFRSFERHGLGRGARQTLLCPDELFENWPVSSRTLTVQVRFEHVYDGFTLDAVRCRLRDGTVKEIELDQDAVRYLHRPHSGREAYAEVELDLDARQCARFALVYSCPEHELSGHARAIIEKARANVKPGS